MTSTGMMRSVDRALSVGAPLMGSITPEGARKLENHCVSVRRARKVRATSFSAATDAAARVFERREASGDERGARDARRPPRGRRRGRRSRRGRW